MNYNITFKEIRDKGLLVFNKSGQRTGEFSCEMMVVGIGQRIPQDQFVKLLNSFGQGNLTIVKKSRGISATSGCHDHV